MSMFTSFQALPICTQYTNALYHFSYGFQSSTRKTSIDENEAVVTIASGIPSTPLLFSNSCIAPTQLHFCWCNYLCSCCSHSSTPAYLITWSDSLQALTTFSFSCSWCFRRSLPLSRSCCSSLQPFLTLALDKELVLLHSLTFSSLRASLLQHARSLLIGTIDVE